MGAQADPGKQAEVGWNFLSVVGAFWVFVLLGDLKWFRGLEPIKENE
jgi:hypothetical protein